MSAKLRRHLSSGLRRVARYLDAPTSSDKQWRQLPFDSETLALFSKIQTRTMTSIERVDALCRAVEYVHENSILGDIVECGVWRGGSMMAVALTLPRIGGIRRLWLYDTFTGMPPPGPEDIDHQGRTAAQLMAMENPDSSVIWAKSSLAEVQMALAGTGYRA